MLSDPIELKIAPEQGAVGKMAIEVAGVMFLVPNLIAGSASVEHGATGQE